MKRPEMTPEEKRIRLFVYEFVVRFDRCPTLNEIAREARLTPLATQQILQRLEEVHSALVLSPGSGNLWLATRSRRCRHPIRCMPTGTAGLACASGTRWVSWW